VRWLFPVFGAAFLMVSVLPAAAQTGPDRRAQEQGQKPASTPADAAKESQKRSDEFAEATQKIKGPAGNPECVWLGRRVVNLLWRDDLETAFRHLDLYDRFGCPGGHIQASFRCVVRQGQIDPKAPESLNARVHTCWIDPETPPTPAAAKPGTNPQQ
jgi:hypothetical protein